MPLCGAVTKLTGRVAGLGDCTLDLSSRCPEREKERESGREECLCLKVVREKKNSRKLRVGERGLPPSEFAGADSGDEGIVGERGK